MQPNFRIIFGLVDILRGQLCFSNPTRAENTNDLLFLQNRLDLIELFDPFQELFINFWYLKVSVLIRQLESI